MADNNALLATLEKLKAMGAKSVAFSDDGAVVHVDFFPSIPALDFDTIVPPPPGPGDEDGDEAPIPPAMARLLKRSSVS